MRTQFSKKENTDAGLALLLIILLIQWIFHISIPVIIPVLLVLLIMIYPTLFYIFSLFWYNLSDILGKIISTIFLVIVFTIFVTPVAIIRRLLGKDALQIKKFKKTNDTAFFERNYVFSDNDFKQTF